MKDLLIRLLVIGLLFAAANTGYTMERIRLASGEWPPYQSKGLEHGGAVARIVTGAFALAGLQVELGYFPWTRSYHYAKTGEWDGTFIWFDSPERRELFFISDAVIDIQIVFFHRKDYAFNWKTVHDLKTLRVGGTLGYDYGPVFQKAEEEGVIRAVRKPSDTENFNRLFNGEIHIFPCDIKVGYELIAKNFAPDEAQLFTHHPTTVRAEPHYLLLSKKIARNKHRVALFNKGLQQLKVNGTYDQYIAQIWQGDVLP